MTVLDADGHQLDSRKLGTEKWQLVEYFGKVRRPAAVAIHPQNGTYDCYSASQGELVATLTRVFEDMQSYADLIRPRLLPFG